MPCRLQGEVGVVTGTGGSMGASALAFAREAALGSRRHRRSFWMVSFAFLAAMAFSAVPSPLYGLYRARDHFSVFMVTVAYAVYAVGVLGALLLAGHLSDWFGRRRLLLPALGTAVASAVVFVA